MFILGKDSEINAEKAAKALIKHSHTQANTNTAVYLIIDCKNPLVRAKDYTPRIVPIRNKLDKLEEKSVLLITKDPSTPYRSALTCKGSPTEDVFNNIYTLTKLKSIAKDASKLTKLFKDHDIVVADNRVHKFLPNILGPKFYVKNKKVPFMVQMAKPSADAKLTQSRKSTKLKDERCEPIYVAKQLKSIVKNTTFIPPANGTCLSIKVGYTNWKSNQIVENIQDVLNYLIDAKYQPVGGLLKTVKNVKSVHLKTSESASMPIYKQDIKDENDHGEDSDLDF